MRLAGSGCSSNSTRQLSFLYLNFFFFLIFLLLDFVTTCAGDKDGCHVDPGVLPGLGPSTSFLQKRLSFQISSPYLITELATSSHSNRQEEPSFPVVLGRSLECVSCQPSSLHLLLLSSVPVSASIFMPRLSQVGKGAAARSEREWMGVEGQFPKQFCASSESPPVHAHAAVPHLTAHPVHTHCCAFTNNPPVHTHTKFCLGWSLVLIRLAASVVP